MVIDGRALAREIIEYLKTKPRPRKRLAAILAGSNASSVSFLKKKKEVADQLGVSFAVHQFNKNARSVKLLELFKDVAGDETVGGIILQLPLPKQFQRESFLKILPKEKDVDNLTGAARVLPPVVATTQTVLKKVRADTENKTVAVVGKGFLVGQPIIKWLQGKCKEVAVFNEKSGLNGIERADIVISGVGKAKLFNAAVLKSGAGVIDFGYSFGKDNKLYGDFDPQDTRRISWYTPTPGGTGPILVAELFRNFYMLNQ